MADQVRVDWADVQLAPDGSPIYGIHTDHGVSGVMAGSTLTPRDSAGPRLWAVDEGAGAFSPNGDGSGDSHTVRLQTSEPVSWQLRIVDHRSSVEATASGTGDRPEITWAPERAPEGTYRWELEATDSWGNSPLHAQGDITVDTSIPIWLMPNIARFPNLSASLPQDLRHTTAPTPIIAVAPSTNPYPNPESLSSFILNGSSAIVAKK
jgi:hypothetical protein